MPEKKQLTGTWKLLSWEIKTTTSTIYPFGKDAVGYLMYTEDGYMSAAVMNNNRTSFADGDVLAGTPEEKAAAAETHISYCGTYEIRGDKVIHHIIVSSFPNWVGGQQERTFKLESNRLSLSATIPWNEGEAQTALFVWEHV